MKYVAFDLEISRAIPSGAADWRAFRPLGISCAAAHVSGGGTRLWHPLKIVETETGQRRYASRMTPEECRKMAQWLCEYDANGFTIVTWNGLGFDFDVLAEECCNLEWSDNVKDLARNHVDVFFAMFCERGFGIGLETACKGMGIDGKLEGVSGADAPRLWTGGMDDQRKVLTYVGQDARITGRVYEEIVKAGKLNWISRTGKANYWRLPEGEVLTVSESLALPLPDTSWMSNPWKREKFAGWLNDVE